MVPCVQIGFGTLLAAKSNLLRHQTITFHRKLSDLSRVRDTTSVTYNPVIQIFVQFTWVNGTLCPNFWLPNRIFGTLTWLPNRIWLPNRRHQTITFHRNLSDLSRVRDTTSVTYNPVIQIFVQFTWVNGTLCPNWFWNTSGCQIESSEASNYYISSKIVRFEPCPRHYFRNL